MPERFSTGFLHHTNKVKHYRGCVNTEQAKVSDLNLPSNLAASKSLLIIAATELLEQAEAT